MHTFYGILLIFVLFSFPLQSQAQLSKFSFCVSNNSASFPITGYPGLFTDVFHPGIGFGAERKLSDTRKQYLSTGLNIDSYYHQHIQTLVRVYPELNYNIHFNERLSAFLGISAGYGMGFQGKNAFNRDIKNEYSIKQKLNFRSQWVAGLQWGFSMVPKLKTDQLIGVFIGFKSFLQGTFIKGYVPFLPLNSVEAGISIPLKAQQ